MADLLATWREEWGKVKKVLTSFLICMAIVAIVSVVITCLLFEHLIIEGKNTTIDALKTKLDLIEKGTTVNDSYEQPLLSADAVIQVIVDSNRADEGFYETAEIYFTKKGFKLNEKSYFSMAGSRVYIKPLEKNKTLYKATVFNLDDADDVIDKPISELYIIDDARIVIRGFEDLPPDAKVIRGSAFFKFNNIVHFTAEIPPQTIERSPTNGYPLIKISNFGENFKTKGK